MPFKKIASIVMVILVVTIVILSINIFINKLSNKAVVPENSKESVSLQESIEESQEETQKVHEAIDLQYDKNLYSDNIKSFEAVILAYNLDIDKNYLPDTLFVGDSNTAGLSSFGYMPLQNVLAKPSMAIQAVRTKEFVWFSGYSTPFTIVNSIPLLKPRRIIVNFGTNNTVGTSLKDFTSIYRKTLKDINESYPYADIIVAAVLPVGKYRVNTRIKMQTIDSFNIALAQICMEDGYKFLNTTEVFKDPDTGFMKPNYVASDGIHLNSVGFNALLEYITDHKLMTQDKRPPRGFIPKRVTAQPPADSPPEFDKEPGEDVVFPPTLEPSTPKPESTPKPDSTQASDTTSSADNSVSSSKIDSSENQILDPFL